MGISMKRATVPKLIVVDGLSGSGKTTTCRWLEQQLHQRHLETRAFYDLFAKHQIPKLAIEVTQGDWAAYYAQIRNAVLRDPYA
jgi:cytidylate kinase